MTILSIAFYFLAFIAIIGSIGNKIKPKNPNQPVTKEQLKGSIILGVIFLILGYIAWPNENKSDRGPKKEDISKLDVDAYVMSEEFIKKQLKAPATADFPGGSDGRVKYLGDSIFYIDSYVDAQNSFGANLRSNYSGKVKYMGSDQWTNVDLILKENN